MGAQFSVNAMRTKPLCGFMTMMETMRLMSGGMQKDRRCSTNIIKRIVINGWSMDKLNVRDIIEDWAEEECIIHCDSIKHRLWQLAEWAEEDEEDDEMNVSSLLDALEFLNSRGALSLSPDGKISISWDIYDHRLIIQFEGSGKTQAVLMQND